MKKNIMILLVLVLLLSGCGKKDESGSSKNVNLSNTKKVSFHDLQLEIPTIFTRDEENSSDDFVIYGYDNFSEERNNFCNMYISFSEYTSDNLKDNIKDSLLLENEDFSFKEQNINGNTWSIGFYEESKKDLRSAYSININDTNYSIKYEDMGSGDLCEKALKVIENSLKFN